MSELEARKYTSIRNLREEIRQDMEDYKQFAFATQKELNRDKEFVLFDRHFEGWFFDYIKDQITYNIILLKELVEQNNE